MCATLEDNVFPGNFQVAIYFRAATLLASILAWTGPSSSCYILLEIRVKGLTFIHSGMDEDVPEG